jgi:nitrite reductase/ring-hydroxylating ferredoxin subunit
VNIDRDAQVILVRASGKVFAFALSCPHQNAAVKWVAKDRRFQCTKHDSRYQPDGAYTEGHATRNLDRFPIRREADAVIVSLDAVFRSRSESSRLGCGGCHAVARQSPVPPAALLFTCEWGPRASRFPAGFGWGCNRV